MNRKILYVIGILVLLAVVIITGFALNQSNASNKDKSKVEAVSASSNVASDTNTKSHKEESSESDLEAASSIEVEVKESSESVVDINEKISELSDSEKLAFLMVAGQAHGLDYAIKNGPEQLLSVTLINNKLMVEREMPSGGASMSKIVSFGMISGDTLTAYKDLPRSTPAESATPEGRFSIEQVYRDIYIDGKNGGQEAVKAFENRFAQININNF